MSKLFKYFKPYILFIILTIGIVFIEVNAELGITECIGNLVSKGIEQHGIEDYVPLIIDNKTKENIINLTLEKNKNFIEKSYIKLENKEQLSNNKKLKNINLSFKGKNLYIITNYEQKNIDLLNKILITPLSILTADDNLQTKKLMISNTSLKINKPINNQILKMNSLDKEKNITIINNNISKIESNILKDMVVKKVKADYQNLNLNIESLQNNYIKRTSIKMFTYILLAVITWVSLIFIASVVSAGISKNLKKDVFKKVNEFSKFEVDKFSTSSLITRTINDVTQLQYFLFFFIEDIFFAPIYGISAFKKAYKINPQMSWVIITVIFVMLLLTSLILLLAVPKYNIVQKLIDKINLVTRENLTGLLSIRAFNAQKFEKERFNEVNKKITKTNLFIERVMALITPLIFLITNISTLIIVWVSYKYILNYTLQVGSIIVYINYTMCVIFSFLMMSMMIVDFPKTYVSIKRIFEVLNTKSVIKDDDVTTPLNYNFIGKLTFNNVSFRYPDASEYILKNVSFTANPGQTTAIIGTTGSGKSTIVNLIPRFYDVTDGEILLDNINIKNIAQHQLRANISYAPQKGVLFKGNIASNVKYGNNLATDEEMLKVCEIAQAKEFIEQNPEKFLREISQGGTNVSGGQRQRLSIARAIMKQSKIYIFDDSFSALDFQTDLNLRKALNKFIKNSTIIIIAQRIGTIINADQIIVLDQGEIVGKGTHKELLENCKEYYDMALIQLPSELL